MISLCVGSKLPCTNIVCLCICIYIYIMCIIHVKIMISLSYFISITSLYLQISCFANEKFAALRNAYFSK